MEISLTKKKKTASIALPVAAKPKATIARSNAKLQAQVQAAGGKDVTKEGPGFLDRVFGPLDTLGAGVRSLVHNAVNGDEQDVDPWQEMGKSLRGEKRVEGADIVGHWGVNNPWGKMLGGLAVDILLDPITWASFGYGALTKAAAKDALVVGAEHGFDAMKMLEAADTMNDASKAEQLRKAASIIEKANLGENAAEAVKLLQTGERNLPRALQYDVYHAVLKGAAEQTGKAGGIKFMGQEILPVQPLMDAASQGVQTLIADKAPAVGKLFSVTGKTMGAGPVNQIVEKAAMGTRAAYANAAEEARRGITSVLYKEHSDDLLNNVGPAVEAALPDEAWRSLSDLYERQNELLTKQGEIGDLLQKAATSPTTEKYGNLTAQVSSKEMDRLRAMSDEIEGTLGEVHAGIIEVLKQADPENVRRYLLQQGLDPEEVNKFADDTYPKILTALDALTEQKRAAGVGENTWMGGALKEAQPDLPLSTGYFPRRPEQVASEGKNAVLQSLLDKRATEAAQPISLLDDGGKAAETAVVDNSLKIGLTRKEYGSKDFWEAYDAAREGAPGYTAVTLDEILPKNIHDMLKKQTAGGMGEYVLNDGEVRLISEETANALGSPDAGFYIPPNAGDANWEDAIYIVPSRMNPFEDALYTVLHELNHQLRTEGFRLDPEDVASYATRFDAEEQKAHRMATKLYGLAARQADPRGVDVAGRLTDIGAGVADSGQEALSVGADALQMGENAPKVLHAEDLLPMGGMPKTGATTTAGKIHGRNPEYLTLTDLVAKAGAKPEMDAAQAFGGKMASDIRALGEAQAQDTLVHALGKQVMGAKTEAEAIARAADGNSVIRLTRHGLDQFWEVPQDAKQAWDSFGKAFTEDDSIKAFGKFYDKSQGLLKKGMTQWNVGTYNARNHMWNGWMMWAHDLGDAEAYAKGMYWLKSPEALINLGDEGTITAKEAVERALLSGGTEGEFLKAEAGRALPLGERAKNPLQLFDRAAGKIANTVEDGDRLGAWVAAKRAGLSDKAAANAVNQALYNFSPEMYTAFESKFLARVIPFYRWFRNNTPEMLNVLAHTPGKMTWMSHLQQNAEVANPIDESVMPEYLSKMFVIPLPIKDNQGNTVIWRPNSPMEDIQNLSGEARQYISSISPLLRTPLELLTNKDWYFDQAVSNYPGEVKRAPGYLERFDDLVRFSNVTPIQQVWNRVKEATGIQTVTGKGEPYLAMNAYAVKAMRDLIPWMNNVGKFVDDQQRSPYDRLTMTTGLKLIPYETEKFAQQKAYNDQDKLQNEVKRLKATGKLAKKKPKVKQTITLVKK